MPLHFQHAVAGPRGCGPQRSSRKVDFALLARDSALDEDEAVTFAPGGSADERQRPAASEAKLVANGNGDQLQSSQAPAAAAPRLQLLALGVLACALLLAVAAVFVVDGGSPPAVAVAPANTGRGCAIAYCSTCSADGGHCEDCPAHERVSGPCGCHADFYPNWDASKCLPAAGHGAFVGQRHVGNLTFIAHREVYAALRTHMGAAGSAAAN